MHTLLLKLISSTHFCCVAQYNSWFTFSEYEEPVTIRSCRQLHARELATVSIVLLFANYSIVSYGLLEIFHLTVTLFDGFIGFYESPFRCICS